MNFLEALFKVAEGIADFCDDTGFPSPTSGDGLHVETFDVEGKEEGEDDAE